MCIAPSGSPTLCHHAKPGLLRLRQRSAVPTSEQYSVFRAYLDKRHRHGGMADMTVLDYAMMVEDSHVETRIIEYRKRGVDTGITGRGEDRVGRGRLDLRDGHRFGRADPMTRQQVCPARPRERVGR